MYFIVCMQVWGGFPRLYSYSARRHSRELGSDEELRKIVLRVAFPLMAALLLVVVISILSEDRTWSFTPYFLFAAFIAGGLYIRSIVARSGRVPPRIPQLGRFNNHRMALFDVWTFGISIFVAAVFRLL